jgi:hypothetical protein
MKPNIIFIVSDDLGYADLGCYGARVTPLGPVSPNIDALAAAGLRFTEGYANSPVCSPTRFALMTMRYQYRVRAGMEEPINSKSRGDPRLGLPAEVPTLPSRLREAGYAGELRAVGDVLIDQLSHMRRCGFDSFAPDKRLDEDFGSGHFGRHWTFLCCGAVRLGI